MPRKITVLRFALTFSLMTFFVAGSIGARGLNLSPTPNQASSSSAQNCSQMTDEQIKNAIVKKIKADHDLDSEWKDVPPKRRHLSISVKNRVVTIAGFVSGEARKSKVIQLAKETGCNVVSDHFCPAPCGSCDPSLKKCGALCIDPNDPCGLVR